ncbi:MAG: phosphoribosylglycinamide formyltransferase [Phycisphaeraceae bacterium]|nr:MAG: phosphoribosylglycinamide formyltransferase [Phycisphaeraceae bacterium]
MNDRRARLGVLISGSGRTLMNLYERCERGELDAEIVDVIASKKCVGVDRALATGLPVEIIEGDIPGDVLANRVERLNIDWLILAGYLRLIPIPAMLRRRVLNIHPALLPGDGTRGRFGGPGLYGSKVHKAVLAAGETESGCTVHFCDDEYDSGPVILRKRCPVLAGDTPEKLAARVFELELEAYPEALQLLIDGARTNV